MDVPRSSALPAPPPGFQNRRVQLVPRIDPPSGAGNIRGVGGFAPISCKMPPVRT
jgi:hypothetical protein